MYPRPRSAPPSVHPGPTTRRRRIRAWALGGSVAFAILAFTTNASAAARVELGEAGQYGSFGEGWGEVAPSRIYNGGVPSGLATNIRWRNWGAPVATGAGLTSIYRPEGGYYPGRHRIELRALRRSSCDGVIRAYTRLLARVPSRPGGPLGRWFLWGGDRSICTSG